MPVVLPAEDYARSCTSPRESLPSRWSRSVTPRSHAVREGESLPVTPKGGGMSDARAQDCDEEPNGPRAFVPYSQRVRGASPRERPGGRSAGAPARGTLKSRTSRSTSPHTQDDEQPGPLISHRRLQALYGDYEFRRKRHLARMEEKRVREEEDLKQQQRQATGTTRTFDKGSFLNWYSDRMGRKQEIELARWGLKRNLARLKADEELVECSFRPLSPARPLSPSTRANSRSFTVSMDASAHAGRQRDLQQEQVIADELITAQITQLETLRSLDIREQDRLAAAQRQHAHDLSADLEESKHKLERFAASSDGRLYLAERARNYAELNPGMDEAAAVAEAVRDLVRASEEKLRCAADEAFRNRTQSFSRQLAVERMQIVYELIQLQRKYQDLVEAKAVPRPLLRGFDHKALDRLVKAPWYAEAREAANS